MLVPLVTLPLVALAGMFAVRRWRVLAYMLGALALVPPFAAGAPPIARFVLALVACGGLARVVELVGERETPARRVLRALTILDWRSATRAAPHIAPRDVGLAVVYGATTTLALLALSRSRPGALWPGWALGAVAVWAFAETVDAVLAVAFGLAGVRVAALHDRPLTSRSLAELWGRRWNLTVSRWLHGTVFAPIARRHSASLGVFASFVASALFHAYVAGAAGGALVACVMASFFVVEGMLMIVERALHLRGSRAWFFVAVLLPSPLFVEPMIAIVMPTRSSLGQPAARTGFTPLPSFTGR